MTGWDYFSILANNCEQEQFVGPKHYIVNLSPLKRSLLSATETYNVPASYSFVSLDHKVSRVSILTLLDK